MMRRHPDPTALSRLLVPFVEEYYDHLVYEPDPLAGYRLSSGQRLPHIRVNADGYRGREFTGGESLLLLGDSVTFGVGASSDEACFARSLEAAMREPVADASMRAYRVSQHFVKLPHLLTVVPRVRRVVLWCGYADVIYWVIFGGRIEGMFDFSGKYGAGRRALAQSARLRRMVVTAVRHVSEAVLRRLDGSSNRLRIGTIEDLVSSMGAHMAAMRDLCTARAVAFHVLLQPFLRIPPAQPELRIVVDGYNRKAEERCGQSWYAVAPAFVEAFKEEMARRKIRSWVDCQDWVEEGDFFDQVHLREEALRRIAHVLAKTSEFWTADTDALVSRVACSTP
jgi:hypothetical protein